MDPHALLTDDRGPFRPRKIPAPVGSEESIGSPASLLDTQSGHDEA